MSGRPFVTLKLATSLDGRIATSSGESKWITGEVARAAVHELRAAHDAILVGIGTVLADDPLLTVRPPRPGPQPVRIVLDLRLDTPLTSRLVETAREAPVWIYCSLRAFGDKVARLNERGVVVRWPAIDPYDMGALLNALPRTVSRVLVEGGKGVATAFLKQNLVDRIEWFRAPILLGSEGMPAVGELALPSLAAAPRYRRTQVRTVGEDLWETLERRTDPSSPDS